MDLTMQYKWGPHDDGLQLGMHIFFLLQIQHGKVQTMVLHFS